MKKFLIVCALSALIITVLAACGAGNTSGSNGATGSSGNTVHMNDANFVQSSVTIKKGESLNLVNDVSAIHIIQNGEWVGGAPKSNQEAGAPAVQAVQIQGGGSQSVGPFTTAGTFKLYCTVHPGMNLTVIVQ